MKRRLIGIGLFAGIGLGETFAWLMLRGGCRDASGMIAVSTFGPGMALLGVVYIVRELLNGRIEF